MVAVTSARPNSELMLYGKEYYIDMQFGGALYTSHADMPVLAVGPDPKAESQIIT